MTSMERGAIFFLTGPPGVGKSTAARALANRSEKSILFSIDEMRQRVVKGLAQPGRGGMTNRTRKQFRLAHIATGQAAAIYANAGFDVIAEHSSHTEYIELFTQQAGLTMVVSLRADTTTNLERNRLRTSSEFDFSILDGIIEMLAKSMPIEHAEAGFPVLDTTNLTADDTATKILDLGSKP